MVMYGLSNLALFVDSRGKNSLVYSVIPIEYIAAWSA